MSIELATAYVSLVAETTKLESGLKAALNSSGKKADEAGKDIGKRIADKASQALRDKWRPDKDMLGGVPRGRLEQVGVRIGQIIGKGVSSGLKARNLGKDFTNNFSQGAASVGIGRIISEWRGDLAGQSNKLGFVAGKAMSAGITAAVGAGVAGVGLALTKGFDRLVALDTANYKLKQILKASGKDTAEADKLSKSIQKSVEGTPFSLDQAFKTAVQAIGAGAEDIEGFMTSVADAAGFAGVELDRMGLIFTQVLAKGKLTGEETMQLMEAGLPARSWIEKSYNMTADQFDDMQRKGEITLEMLEKSIRDHAPGMAKALGDTLQGSIDNMQTAIARVGANFLAAVFGGDTGDPTEGMKDAVQRLTDLLKQLDAWIVANRDEIRAFFTSAADAAGTLLGVLGSIASTLKDHPGLIQAVVTAFVAWQSIKGVSAVLTAISGINTGLRAMPGLAGAALGPVGALTSALLAAGTAAYFLGTAGDSPMPGVSTPSDPTGERGLQNRRTGTSIMGVPSAVDAPIFGGSGLLGGGGSFDNFSIGDAITGSDAITGGVPGTAGRGFMNPQAVNDYLDNLASKGGGFAIGSAGSSAATMLVPGDFSSIQAAGTSKFGLAMTSGYRPPTGPTIAGVSAATSYHGSGRAQDYAGTPEQMLAFANYLADTYGPQLKELIFDHPSFSRNINNGRSVGPFGQFYTLDQAGRHDDHVHVAFDEGGWLQPGTRLVTNDTGKPELVLNPEQQGRLADMGVDPNTLLHGTGNAAPPGPQQQGQSTDFGSDFVRSLGFIPANAGNTSVAGTSSLAGFIQMGNEVVGGLIDTGASLAQMAVNAGMAAGTFGGSAAAGPAAGAAAGYGIQLAASTAKRLSSYGFQLASIGADALIEQLFPFGAPRAIGYDYTSFAPRIGLQNAALGTLEAMGADAINNAMRPPQGPAPVEAEAPPPGVTPPPPPPAAQTPPPFFDPTMLGSYDQGGMLPPGGLGINMTNRPEPVLTPQQWDAIISSSSSPGRDAPLVENLYAQDMQDAIRQLEKTKRRDMMQYAGRP